MEKEYFDLAIEGTSLSDIFKVDMSRKCVVIDKNSNYGSTFSSLSSLSKSPFIRNLKIKKDLKKKVLIESIPYLLDPMNKIVKNNSEKPFGGEIEYIKISDIYFISQNRIKIPTNKNEILQLGLSNRDNFYLFKAIKERNINILDSFDDKSSLIYEAMFKLGIFDDRNFNIFCKNFGNASFVYPVYGLSEISETICMKNSFNGVTYVLNESLEHMISDEEPYKHKFVCDLGIIMAKEYQKRELKKASTNVRVVLTSKTKFSGNFLAFIKNSDENSLEKFTTVIGLNSLAEVCDENLQLIYLIRKSSPVLDTDIGVLELLDKDILLDISFDSLYTFAD